MMYLLLRNNKQSGPYSLDELKTMGLKAYDLVWVDGRSAAWRYPCEVEELSAFAPAVEEQPFDRFYAGESRGRFVSRQVEQLLNAFRPPAHSHLVNSQGTNQHIQGIVQREEQFRAAIRRRGR